MAKVCCQWSRGRACGVVASREYARLCCVVDGQALGVVGGSGLFKSPLFTAFRPRTVSTQFGDVTFQLGKLPDSDADIVFCQRHGALPGKTYLLPHEVPFAAMMVRTCACHPLRRPPTRRSLRSPPLPLTHSIMTSHLSLHQLSQHALRERGTAKGARLLRHGARRGFKALASRLSSASHQWAPCGPTGWRLALLSCLTTTSVPRRSCTRSWTRGRTSCRGSTTSCASTSSRCWLTPACPPRYTTSTDLCARLPRRHGAVHSRLLRVLCACARSCCGRVCFSSVPCCLRLSLR